MINTRRIVGSILTTIGFLLSPLSWWNDLLVNIPIAYLLSSLLSKLVPGYFAMFMVVSYWLTNILGLILMHKGGTLILAKQSESYTAKSILKDLETSLLYSIIIAFLVATHILKLPSEYFH